MVEIDEYLRVSTHLMKTLQRLSSDKQADKYAILAELYKFLFGIGMAGNSDHYLLPLERPSRSRPAQTKLDHEQIRFLLIGGDPPVDDPAFHSNETIGLC